MSSTVFDQMMSRYSIQSVDDNTNALHEVMQQIALAGLYRAGFFQKAAFYGDTCLRIFHSLPQFSEDLDFSLLAPDEQFSLENYFDAIINEFVAMGREVEITKKEKKQSFQISSAFLKDTTDIYNIRFRTHPQVKIKIEVDTHPPLEFSTESKLLLLPFSFMVRCFSLPDLFAGKMHAFLFRNWNKRVKGRDWYDFEWYVRNQIPLGFNHLRKRTEQTFLDKNPIQTIEDFKTLLQRRILDTPIDLVKKDVLPFIKNPSETEIWSTDYFLQLSELIHFPHD